MFGTLVLELRNSTKVWIYQPTETLVAQQGNRLSSLMKMGQIGIKSLIQIKQWDAEVP